MMKLYCRPAHFFLLLLVALVLYSDVAVEASDKAIPLDQLGAEAQKNYTGDGIAITPTAQGALLRSTFQKLEGEATTDGLWLSSTSAAEGAPERFRVLATALGRSAGTAENSTSPLPLTSTGTVSSTSDAAALMRPGLLEEYRVSMDGVRQDFVVLQRLEGAGALRVTLAVTGAQVTAVDYGIKFTLPRSGREIGYSRLHVTDAAGRELSATLEVLSADRIAVCVEDATATYPVRIDPTFSDADWVGINPGVIGVNSIISAMVVDDSGNLYIGGSVYFAGATSVSNIAKWDGMVWSTLGTGLNSSVKALAVSGTDIYAGGYFTTADGETASNIAKWNGSVWSALGTGMDGVVTALTMSGGILYAGGAFTTAGGVSARHIAQWDGSAWSALGTGMDKNVLALAVMGTDLYAGGQFTTAGGVAASCIAKWDGTAWSVLGAGLSSSTSPEVKALAVSGTTLYAGGAFSHSAGISTPNIAKWDGSTWSWLPGGSSSPVLSLGVNGTDVYAGAGSTAPVISKWNGSTWSVVGTGLTSTKYLSFGIYALAFNGTDLYAGGRFSITAGGSFVFGNIAKWNGSAWSQLYRGINNDVKALVVSGSYLYAGGAFTTAGGMVVNGISRWDGNAWTALGTGVNGTVKALLAHGTDLYVGGTFTLAGGVTVNGIAKWDGIAWNALGQGVGGVPSFFVSALAMIGTDLYAGGFFSTAGGVAASGIAKWDGNVWSALDTGLGGVVSPVAFALAVTGTDLYAGGAFTTAGGVSASNVAKWDGSGWSSLGAGYSGTVNALAASSTHLYLGGGSSSISIWDGSSWSVLTAVIYKPIYALLVSGTNLYVGGGYNGQCLAKWDGNSWSTLGSGIHDDVNFNGLIPYVSALTIDSGNHLYVGGTNFSAVGNGIVSPYLAQANLPTPVPDIGVAQSAVLSDGSGIVDFGPAGVGSSNLALTFTLTNPGDAELSGLGLSLDGANAADFTVSTLASTHFVPGNTLTFTVTYSPATLVTSSAVLHIASNVSGTKSPFDIALTGMGVTPNQGWQQQYFGVITGFGDAAPDADPNHNGIPNLIEYALGGDPTGGSMGTGILPTAVVNTAGQCLQINLNRYLERNDITLTVQAADDLAGPWTDLAQSVNGSSFVVVTTGTNIAEVALGNPRAVSVCDLYQTADPAHPRRFMRLKVSQ